MQAANDGDAEKATAMYSCLHCVERPGLNCTDHCPEITAAMLNHLAKNSLEFKPRCTDISDLENFHILVQVSTITTTWSVLLGVKYAAESVVKLLPLCFSLMFGSWKAGALGKSMIPYSRIPGFAVGASVLFTFPFIFSLVIVMQSVMGTTISLLAFIFFLLAILVNFPLGFPRLKLPGLVNPLSHKEARGAVKKVGIAFKVFSAVSLILIIIDLATSELMSVAAGVFERAGLELAEEDKERLQRVVITSSINAGMTFLGKSLISTIFFADTCLEVMHFFHHGEEYDSISIQISRRSLIDNIHHLFTVSEEPNATPIENAAWPVSQLRSQLEVICSDLRETQGIQPKQAIDWAMRQLQMLVNTKNTSSDAWSQPKKDARDVELHTS